MLPLHCDIQTFIEYAVAPYVGAWIETPTLCLQNSSVSSHPTWVRGLKQLSHHEVEYHGGSHPTWVRGLKQKFKECADAAYLVAPYVGAWIETVSEWR